MSKIAADNLRAPTAGVETPMQYPVRGSAKAWWNLNGTGTIAIRDSLNVSSATDVATGAYSANYSSVFSNTSYSNVCGAENDDGFYAFAQRVNSSVSLLRIRTYGGGIAATDCSQSTFAVWGALA